MRDPQLISGSTRARIRSSDCDLCMTNERGNRAFHACACALVSRLVDRLENGSSETRIIEA